MMAKQTLDYQAMYIVAGDIDGSIGRYSNTLDSVGKKAESASNACDKAEKYNGKWIEDGEVTEGRIIYKKYKMISINDSAAKSSLNVLSSSVDSAMKDLRSLRKEANESEAVAAGIKAHVKKMQSTLKPDDIAKIWSALGLSMDMYNAKVGNKVGISDNGADWDGIITFKKMPNGTYLVLKGDIPMGYCTVEQKKAYYAALYNANKDIKKMVDDETTKKDMDKVSFNKKIYEEIIKKSIAGVNKGIKDIFGSFGKNFSPAGMGIEGAEDVPDELKKFLDNDFAGKSGLKLVRLNDGSYSDWGGVEFAVVDSSGKVVGKYAVADTPFIGMNVTREGYDFVSSAKALGADALGLGIGAVEGVAQLGEFGAKVIGTPFAGFSDLINGEDSLKQMWKAQPVREAFNDSIYKTGVGKFVLNNGHTPDFTRGAGNIAGGLAAGNAISGAGAASETGTAIEDAASATNYVDDVVNAADDVPKLPGNKPPALVDDALDAGAKSAADTGSKSGADAFRKAAEEDLGSAGAKTAADSGAKTAADSGAKAAADSGAKTAAESGAKSAAKDAASEGVKKTYKEAGKLNKAMNDAESYIKLNKKINSREEYMAIRKYLHPEYWNDPSRYTPTASQLEKMHDLGAKLDELRNWGKYVKP